MNHFVDTNFLDTYDTLMEQQRKEVVCQNLNGLLGTGFDLNLTQPKYCQHIEANNTHHLCG